MTSATQEEKCRVIAEWLKLTPFLEGFLIHECGSAQPSFFTECEEAECRYFKPAPNFYASESASALILEKMLSSGISICMEPSLTHPGEIILLCPYYLGGGGTMFRHLRLKAIAEAGYYRAVLESRKGDE